MKLIFPADRYEEMAALLLEKQKETCAILLASPPSKYGTLQRILVREIHYVPDNAYSLRSTIKATIDPEFLISFIARIREEKLCIVFVHTHPSCEGTPAFSDTDDLGEIPLATLLENQAPGLPHAALVIGPNGCAARKLGTSQPLDVIEVGQNIRYKSHEANHNKDDRWDRQIRAFGQEGQSHLQEARVGIVGLGGTGSVVAQQLTYLGVSNFILIDPESIEATNLNRLVGSTVTDVGRPKVDIVARAIKKINQYAKIQTFIADISDVATAHHITDLDVIFSCTDSHASRAMLNQIAYQYYIPLFDMGVSIGVKDHVISHIAGRVQMAAPGLACLICANVIDANAVRSELMTPEQRAADPYIVGHHEPQPAVISLNSTVTSLAVTMFMAAFTAVPASARFQLYNGISGTVKPVSVRQDPTCIVCSQSGALGLADMWPLPGRSTIA